MRSQFNSAMAGLLVLGTLVAPFATFAATTTSSTTTTTTTTTTTGPKQVRSDFCTRLATDSQRLLNGFDPKIDVRNIKHAENEKARLDKLAALRGDRDDKLKIDRDESQAKRDVRYDALTKRADTPAKQAAVAAYKAAVDAATAKRIAAVDAAVKAHRDGVDALVKTKFATLDTGTATLKAAVDAAIAQAKTDCANNVAPQTARAKLVAAAKAAQNIFKANRNDSVIKAQLETLNAARKTAVEAALTQFRTDMQKATADLKLAFGVK